MKRERLARIKNIRTGLIEMANELDDIWDEETKEMELVDLEKEFISSEPLVHSGSTSIVTITEEQYPRIEDLKEGDENFHLKARVAAIGKQMAGTTKDNKEWRMLTIHLNDDTSTISMPLFNEEIDKADGLRIDDWVVVKAWKVEKYKTMLQVKLGKFGTITKVSS